NHEYLIVSDVGLTQPKECKIQFQNGARKEKNSIHGIIDTDLLEVVRDRLHCFQQGKFASEYNYQALIHVEEALMWLNRRVEDRIERNVLGTNNK
ncbi:ABC transporter ATPase, partial [Clostridium botulinum]